MRRVSLLYIVVALSTWVVSARAATPPPPTMRSRLVGSWEGIGEGDFRIFKIEVASRDEASIVAMTAGQANSVTLLFTVNRIDLRDQRFELDATGTDGPAKLRIRGKVKRLGQIASEGVIDANVALIDQKSRPINSWHVVLMNFGGGYLHQLCQLSADATAKLRATTAGNTQSNGHLAR